MDFKLAEKIERWTLLLFFVLFFAGIFSRVNMITNVAVVMFFVGEVIKLVFWRCPHCGKMMLPRYKRVKYTYNCPHCKNEVEIPEMRMI